MRELSPVSRIPGHFEGIFRKKPIEIVIENAKTAQNSKKFEIIRAAACRSVMSSKYADASVLCSQAFANPVVF